MRIDPNDPRLTAYALGELENEDDCVEIEQALQHSEELTRVVAQIRQTADLVMEELQKEPSPGLSREHQQRIERKLGAPVGSYSFKGKWAMIGALSAAACLLLAIVLTPNMLQSRSGTVTMAELRRPEVDPLASQSRDQDQPLVQEPALGVSRYQAVLPEEVSPEVQSETSAVAALAEAPALKNEPNQTTEPESQPATGVSGAVTVGGEL